MSSKYFVIKDQYGRQDCILKIDDISVIHNVYEGGDTLKFVEIIMSNGKIIHMKSDNPYNVLKDLEDLKEAMGILAPIVHKNVDSKINTDIPEGMSVLAKTKYCCVIANPDDTMWSMTYLDGGKFSKWVNIMDPKSLQSVVNERSNSTVSVGLLYKNSKTRNIIYEGKALIADSIAACLCHGMTVIGTSSTTP